MADKNEELRSHRYHGRSLEAVVAELCQSIVAAGDKPQISSTAIAEHEHETVTNVFTELLIVIASAGGVCCSSLIVSALRGRLEGVDDFKKGEAVEIRIACADSRTVICQRKPPLFRG